ncbi:MAG: zinc-dependent metalloprotease family protein [Pseudomonadota bacterium]
MRVTALAMSWALGIALTAAGFAQASEIQILHSDIVRDVRIVHKDQTLNSKDLPLRGRFGVPMNVSFSAHGRAFDLILEDNANLPGDLPNTRLLRGYLTTQENSWARITISPRGLSGVIFDGTNTFFIEPPEEKSGHSRVIRAQDIQTSELACGTHHTDSDYDSLLHTLGKLAVKTPTAFTELKVSLVMGQKYRQDYGSQALPDMLAAFNVVDGIFSEQLGVQITAIPTDITLNTSTDGERALEQLADLREQRFDLHAAGVTHLFSSKNISIVKDQEQRDIVGIAYVDVLCSKKWGVSLTEAGSLLVQDALVTAHELGHNFGAVHDGVEPCGHVADNVFLMAPRYNGVPEFSHCSLNLVKTRMSNAGCIRSLNRVDVALSASNTTVKAIIDEPTPLTLQIHNRGSAYVPQSEINLETNSDSVSIDIGGSSNNCSHTGSGARCIIDNLVVGTTRTLSLSVSGSVRGTHWVTASVNTPNDILSGNNELPIAINVSEGVDLSLAFDNATQQANLRDDIQLNLNIAGDQNHDARQTEIRFTYPNTLSLSQSPEGLDCSSTTTGLLCDLGTWPGNKSVATRLIFTSDTAGTHTVTAVIQAEQVDPNTQNNSTSTVISVGPEASSSTVSSGGGAVFWFWALLLLLRSNHLSRMTKSL